MTVSSTTTKNSYSGDGSTTTFAYAFKIFADADLTVILRSAAGTETVQTLTTNYTVTNAGNASGGNVVFVTAPASGVTVVIRRNMAQTQSTDYTANDPFPAESHEDALDRLTFIAQQQQEELDRSIKLSRTNTMTSTEFTVGATERGNKILAFDSSGEISVTQELGTYQGTDATTTTEAYVVRDIVKSTTAGQLNNVYICVADSVVGDLLTDTDHFELLVDAVSAATSATSAASSASAAATSATAAATSATAAATSATNASTSETNASTSASTASTKASEASTSATNAATSETNAATSATTASTQATAASTSATAAAASESNASTSASNASTSATNAATSETNAATSATTATTKASEASTSASNAATSATAAQTAQTAAEAAQTAAETAADNFDDTYLGAKSSDPTVDNDGDALNAGDLYFNTTSNSLKVYTGSAWADAAITASDFLTVANNLSDLNNAGTARTNLGLGTAATSASTDFVAVTGDSMTGNLTLGDNVKAIFGAGSDLQIYHDGTNSYVSDEGTGNLILRGSNELLLGTTAGQDILKGTTGGDVKIYYNNSQKLATKSDGVDITGELQTDTLDVDGTSNFADDITLVGAAINMPDNESIRFGAGLDLVIFHDAVGGGSYINEQGTGDLNIQAADIIFKKYGTSEVFADFNADGAVELYYDASKKFETVTDGIYVTGNVQSSSGAFEGASDQDKIVVGASQIDFYINNSNEFRMESDGDFHADGDVIAYSTTVSDERLKTDIEKIENATDKVSQLNGYTFTYKADGKKSAGVIAQEVEKVLPSAVSEKELPLKTDDGVAYKTVQYDQIIGLLIESIKELKQEINELKGK